MASYVVLKRMVSAGEDTLPGVVIERDETEQETMTLVERGFLMVVPADYRGAAPAPAAVSPADSGDGSAPATEPTNTSTDPTEEELDYVKGLSDDDLMSAIATFGITVPPEADRPGMEEALAAYVAAHRDPEDE